MGTTSLLALQRLASLGNIASGGGGAPTGLPFIVADLAALQAITAADNAVGLTEDDGWQYVRFDGAWGLWRAEVDVVANLPGGDILSGALCLVGPDETALPYYYDGAAWLRMPDGTGYIWPDVADSSALPGVAESGDRCTTTDTGFVWEYDGAVWEIVYGLVGTFAGLPSVDVAGSALVGVGSNGVHERTWYGRHAGDWIRTPEAVPYGRALSAIDDVLTTDVTGDLGVFQGQVYRLASDVAAVGGATVRAWVRPEAYAATRTLQGWYTGSEADAAAVYAKGCIRGVGNNGTASTTGGYLRLATSGSQTETVGFLLNAVAPGTKVYLRFEVRVTTSATYNAFPAVIADGANAVYLAQNNISGGTGGVLSFVNGSAQSIGTQDQYRGGRTALPTTTPDLFEVLDDGAFVTIWRNGAVYASYRRTAVLGSTDRIYLGIGGASGTPNIETRNFVGYTWT